MMKPAFLFWLTAALLSVTTVAAQDDDSIAHLKGIDHLFMEVDTSEAPEIDSYGLQDFSDIVELQLLRGQVRLRPKIANEPEANYPKLGVVVDTSRPAGRNQFFITLRVEDYVTIRRNGRETVATTFEMRRTGSAGNSDQLPTAIKTELRELMLEFVTFFRSANPR